MAVGVPQMGDGVWKSVYPEAFGWGAPIKPGNRQKDFQQAGTEMCQAQLKLASNLNCFRFKDNSGSKLNDLKNPVEITDSWLSTG